MLHLFAAAPTDDGDDDEDDINMVIIQLGIHNGRSLKLF